MSTSICGSCMVPRDLPCLSAVQPALKCEAVRNIAIRHFHSLCRAERKHLGYLLNCAGLMITKNIFQRIKTILDWSQKGYGQDL